MTSMVLRSQNHPNMELENELAADSYQDDSGPSGQNNNNANTDQISSQTCTYPVVFQLACG